MTLWFILDFLKINRFLGKWTISLILSSINKNKKVGLATFADVHGQFFLSMKIKFSWTIFFFSRKILNFHGQLKKYTDNYT